MMPDQKRFVLALFAITLLSVSILGCAQLSFAQKGYAQDDCRFCHSPNAAAGARDLTPIYANSKAHHPVGVNYPYDTTASPDFNPPNGHSDGITFFDRNGNGQPDGDEIRLFGVKGKAKISCASCHREHGAAPIPDRITGDFYLRVKNEGSALCTTCHSK